MLVGTYQSHQAWKNHAIAEWHLTKSIWARRNYKKAISDNDGILSIESLWNTHPSVLIITLMMHIPLKLHCPPLNFESAEGIKASVLDQLMREWAKNEGAKQVVCKWQEEGYSIKQNIKESKKMWTGLLVKNGQHTKQETMDKAKKWQRIMNANINKVKTACNKHGH